MSSEHHQGRDLWRGAIYLSMAAVIIKILSAVYRIPYQNIVGDVGFYVYQQIYPIYGVAITLSTYGFPVIISKLISEKQIDQKIILKNAFQSLFTLCSMAFLIFYFSAPLLARLMGDENLEIPLKVVSFIFFIIPLLSVLRGYFQGREEMFPTAVSQVVEQSSRVCAILLLTYFFIVNGYGPYFAGTGAAFASIIGGLFGFCILFLFYQKQKSEEIKKSVSTNKGIARTIIIQGLMICLSSLLLIIFQFIDSFTVLRFLVNSGSAIEAAKIAKGVYDRGYPLVQMGTVITTSFSLIVVPIIAKVSLEGRLDLIQKYSSVAFRISLLIGAAASLGLAIIIEPTNVMLFKNNTDSDVLGVLGLAIFFTSTFLTTSSILHGLNKVHITVVHVIIGIILKLVLNISLIPEYGTWGAALATVIACAVCVGFNFLALRKAKALPLIPLITGIKIFFSLLALVVITYLWQQGCFIIFSELVSSRLGNALVALSSVAVGVFIFLFFIVASNVFTEDELEHIPKIGRLAAFMQSKKGT